MRAVTEKPVVPDDPAYLEEIDPALREEKFESEFEESSEVEPSSDEDTGKPAHRGN